MVLLISYAKLVLYFLGDYSLNTGDINGAKPELKL